MYLFIHHYCLSADSKACHHNWKSQHLSDSLRTPPSLPTFYLVKLKLSNPSPTPKSANLALWPELEFWDYALLHCHHFLRFYVSNSQNSNLPQKMYVFQIWGVDWDHQSELHLHCQSLPQELCFHREFVLLLQIPYWLPRN